jgi:predicted transcriptional regulator
VHDFAADNSFRHYQGLDEKTPRPLNYLTSDEKQLYQNAVKDLISKGLVKNVKGSSLNLKLTEKGANLIYTQS